MADYPYGPCECIYGSCPCVVSAGPAAFEVTRDGKPMRVCTRCDLTKDKPTEILLVQPGDDLDLYYRYDALGGACLEMRLTFDKVES